MTDELIGKQVGGYVIEERIGRGGMSTVYKALQLSMNRHVALKILPRELMKDPTYLQRFEREVKVVATLEHRNIVPVFDHGEFDGQPYIAMRLMNSGSVDDLLADGPLNTDTILKIITQVAPALDFAHTRGILHRDLKPSNVLLDDDGGAYITDFGIARLLGETGHGMTITTQGVVGTPSYMSPEQAQGQDLDGRSDVYSLGVMLYEMATGRRPFQSDTPYGIAVMQVTTPPPAPRNFNPKISSALETVVLKSMKKKREDRYQTATALAEALKMAIERPNDFHAHDHDTQPSPIPVREMMNAQNTQPSPVQSLGVTQPSPVTPQPAVPARPVVPLPPPQTFTPRTPQDMRAVARLRKKRDGNVWLSVLIGAAIGCALLAIVAIIIMLVASSFMPEEGTTSSLGGSTQSTGLGVSLLPTPTESAEGEGDTASTPDPPAETPTPAPTFTTAPLGERSWLNDGGLLYFSERDDGYEIYRRNLRADTETQLTKDASVNLFPHISPDAQRVVFQSNRDGDYDIYTVHRMGGQLVKIVQNEVDDLFPIWSADGEWIVFSSDPRGDGTLDLFRVRPDGGDLQRLLTNGQRNSHPRWNHDGSRVVFVSGEPRDARTWDIGILDVATGDYWLLTDDNVRDAWPVFHPDGQSVLYVSGSNGDALIKRVRLNADGRPAGFPEVIYDNGEFPWGLSYSPDGEYIAFNSGEIESAPGEVYVVRADGSDLRRLTTNGGAYVSWTP